MEAAHWSNWVQSLVLANSRRSRIAGSGTKLLATEPWRTSWAIHGHL